MTSKPKIYGIIPARYGSSRFPGKPLAEILGKPMFWHVYQRARQCPDLSRLLLATDDERIADKADLLGVEAVLTRPDHPSGTDRIFEAACRLDINDEDVVINIQGDEPMLNPQLLSELARPFSDHGIRVATPVHPVCPEAAKNPDRVKVVFSRDKRALYFSRAAIPFPREGGLEKFYSHIGIYAFRMSALAEFVKLPQGRLENAEKLEQLRLLENNIPIHIVVTEHESICVDRPEDLKEAERLLKNSIQGK